MKLEMLLIGMLSKGIDIAAERLKTSSPQTCLLSQQEQTGKWLFNTTPVVGDCGSLGSFQGEMINGEVKISSNAGCQVTREVWDSKSCTTIKTFKCYNNGINMRLDWTITSDINNYDRASGILHYVSIDDIQSCTSVYNFTAMKIEN